MNQALRLTREAVEDTSKATKAMERQNEMTASAQRPWLDFEVIAAHPAPYTRTDSLSVELRISNHSGFPAHEVKGVGRGHFCSTGLSAILSLKSSREMVKSVLDEWSATTTGDVIFPQRDHAPTVNVDLGDPELFKGKPDIMVRATIGVRYSFDGGVGYTFRDYLLFGVERALEKAHNGSLPPKNVLSYPKITITPDSSSGRAT